MAPERKRAEASALRRRQLMEAALDLFLEAGVGNCRLEDLLERSECSVGSFYHHFGGKPELAAALHLEILEVFLHDFLEELSRYRSARRGVRAMVQHQLTWVAENPSRAAFLFQCLEPEVFEIAHDEESRLMSEFFGRCVGWLHDRASDGQLRKLSGLEYHVLWLGPTLELTRAWLMNYERKWTWMTPEQLDPSGLVGMSKSLADAAWGALKAPP